MYVWIKALHILAVISWMSGMLYLPRLMVYHTDAEIGSRQSETFKVMERRLLKIIINPAMILTWLAGLWLAWDGGWEKAGWLHVKIVLVIVLSAIHGFLVGRVRDFAADKNTRSARFYRILNEVPAVLMIGIVILVVVKPFLSAKLHDLPPQRVPCISQIVFLYWSYPLERRRIWRRPVSPAVMSRSKAARHLPSKVLRNRPLIVALSLANPLSLLFYRTIPCGK